MSRIPIVQLNRATTKRFQEALLAAFPKWSALAQMLRVQLDENLDARVAPGNLGTATFDLLEWAEATGKLDALLTGALLENPGNPKLVAFEASLPRQPPTPAPPQAGSPVAMAPPPVSPPGDSPPPPRYVDPLFADIRAEYARGELILFVGAGISAAAGLPSWKRLVEALLDRARGRSAPAEALQEIADYLARGSFIDALGAVKACLGAVDFGVALTGLLDDRAHVRALPPLAEAIGALAPRLRAVLTTNIDGLLERAFRGEWPAIARATGDIASQRGYILKLHGTLRERDTWVFTREDYDRAMYADPLLQTAFSSLFHACPILFVGYGLADDDFDQVLSRVRALSRGQASRHFALVPRQTITPNRRQRIESAGVMLVPYDNADGTHAELLNLLRAIP
ncbi:MAG: SIR2 family protein [Byssovorax sp.]